MQKITLIGRLTRDAKIVETQNGNKFVAFTMAINSRTGNTDKATFYDVRQFNYNERMAPHFTQGSSLVVIGELDASIENGNDGNKYLRLSVLADSIDFNGSGAGNSSTSGETKVTSVTELQPEARTRVAKATTPVDEEITMGARKNTVTSAPVEDNGDLPF